MATTRIIPLHINKGKTLSDCLHSRLDYAQNPDKTEQGELVSSYECDPNTAAEEFLLSKRMYDQQSSRPIKGDIIAYQIRQSFLPGEVTPEEANQIGYELAMRFTKGSGVPEGDSASESGNIMIRTLLAKEIVRTDE